MYSKIFIAVKAYFSSLKVLFALVIIWSVVGFVYCFDNNVQWGCINDNYVFSFHNISRTAISLAFLTLGFLYRNDTLGRSLMLAEFVYWSLKLFFWKEGYVIGIGGSVPTDIAVFDFVALLLRLLLLRTVFRSPLSNIWLLLSAVALMWVKINYLR